MPQKFTDSHATRIISALDDRAARKNKDSAQIQTTWGTVGAVDAGNKFASAYLYGETDGAYLSAGFRIPETTYLSVGQVVKVNINYATGERWIDEVHPPVTAHKKIAIDTSTGELRQGNGSAQPAVVSFANLPILATITAFIQTLLDDVDAATARATLGLGSFATLSSLAHSSLTGIGANDHHNRSHDHSSASDNTALAPVSVTTSGVMRADAMAPAHYDSAGSSSNVTITTHGTYYFMTSVEVSFTPAYVGQRFAIHLSDFSQCSTSITDYVLYRMDVTDSSNNQIGVLGYTRAQFFGSTISGTTGFQGYWTADSTSARKVRMYATTGSLDGKLIYATYTQLTVVPLL